MKKIVYILAASMLSSSAVFAVAPRVKAVTPAAVKAEKTTLSRNFELNQFVAPQMREALQLQSLEKGKLNTLTQSEISRADVDGVEALYVPSAGSFYLGMSPGWVTWKYHFGFTGIKNLIGFVNASSNADSYEWTYGYLTDYDPSTQMSFYDDKFSNETNLFMDLQPLKEYQAPILEATGANGTETYQAPIESYCTGRSPLEWGFGTVDEETGEISYSDFPGLTSYAPQITGIGTVGYFSYNTTDKVNYDENGCYKGWSNWFVSGNDNIQFSNWKLKAFSTYVPAKPSSYLLSNIYSLFSIKCTEDITLTCNVYYLPTEEGQELGAPVATGQLSIAKGSFPGEDDDLPNFSLVALDEDGYETDLPLVVPALQPLYITIEGFTVPAVTYFSMAVLKGYDQPDATFSWDMVDLMTPIHAYAVMDVDVHRTGVAEVETIETDARCPGAYYTDVTQTAVFSPSDFAIFFDAYFPVVANIDEDSDDYGTTYFNVNVPAEGGSVAVKVASDYSITELIAEGIMTSGATAEWIKYEAVDAESEDGLYTQVTVSVDALPEGESGRQGAVVFRGYASDFEIIVTQGDAAGISNIAAANGKVELFDLQGRRLNAAPAAGIYLERQGNKTVKRIAL